MRDIYSRDTINLGDIDIFNHKDADASKQEDKDILNHEVIDIFRHISRIPRESGNEKAISNWIGKWAEYKGLKVTQDDIWNLTICKPASKGYEDHAPVMLQAHIDMVCEKNNDSNQNFDTDPIEFDFDGEWITSATGTTLGADNGVGVAEALAVLADDSLEHPPLEVVFTVQEETTFAGAENVDISELKAMRLINIDHANEREIIVGSCGGTGVRFVMPIEFEEEVPEGMTAWRIRVTGLMGGHSGEDIHRGRGNAINLLLRVLENSNLQTVSISGGTNRLAIPREDTVRSIIDNAKAVFRREYSGAAPDLDIICEEAEAAPPLTDAAFIKIAAAVRFYPNGIVNMNGSFDGLVESSDNIGIISTEGGVLTITSEVRGAYRSTVDDIVKTIDLLAATLGAGVEYFAAYVPWEFSADSELRNLAVGLYKEMFGSEMKQLALHAGLECGFFAEKRPGMDIISIGPDCEYFHSPRERVRAASIINSYNFLKEMLRRL